jgi:hypothetical protein
VLYCTLQAMEEADKLEAKYANYFQVGQNAIEFILEFGQLYSNEETPLFHTRVITSPVYAKQLLRVLEEAIRRHEDQFGDVREL